MTIDLYKRLIKEEVLMLPFEVSEFKQRLGKVKGSMNEKGIEVLLITLLT